MTVALIIVSIALAISLAVQMFGPKSAPAAHLPQAKAGGGDDDARARTHALEAELEKKKKDLEEQKSALVEVKAQLKDAKRKLYEQKEADKSGNDLVKARAEVERNASVQLEITRAELATALSDLAKLRAEAETRGSKRAAAAAVAAPQASIEQPAPVVQKVIRELSPEEKEKIQRLETQSAKDRAKAGELEREVRRLKGRLETEKRVYTVTRSELDLAKDKFRALEKRLNRTLLERDMTRRAIKDLEKKSGVAAERTELTAEEAAQSDKEVDQRQAAEAAAQKAAEEKVRAEGQAAEAAAAASEQQAPQQQPAAPGDQPPPNGVPQA